MKTLSLVSSLVVLCTTAASAFASNTPRTRHDEVRTQQAPDRHGGARGRASHGQAARQSVIVENHPSAGGILAPELVKNAKPDGYTSSSHIGMATTPALLPQPALRCALRFRVHRPINDVPMTIIARGNFPARLNEFLAYIKANKDKVSYANAGIGAASHLCGMRS